MDDIFREDTFSETQALATYNCGNGNDGKIMRPPHVPVEALPSDVDLLIV